jgi:endonuclease/exonuclease/phosphatase (EEP) superfamily protein YafD
VPRFLYALPLPFIVLALAIWGPRWLLLLQAAATGVWLFPLMGLSLARPAPASGPTLTVMAYNVDYGYHDRKALLEQVAAANPDVVAMEAIDQRLIAPLVAAMSPGRHAVHIDEFFVLSRYPVLDVYEPEQLEGDVYPAFMRVTIDSPLGPVDLYVIHPTSPRPGFDAIRSGGGLSHGLTSGESFAPHATGRVQHNTEVRVRQVEALVAHAATAKNPVIIAGDTNLPGLSPLFRRALGRYQDGWAEVGTGFGYTFPAHKWVPWLRIDRILAGDGLRFVSFTIGPRQGSDHLSVMATLTRR